MWVEDDRIVRAEAHGSDPATTNNRMELMALIEAYRALPADARVTVYSDSELCVKTINEWAEAWERARLDAQDGADREPRARAGRCTAWRGAHPNVSLRWIRAHDGSRWNEYVDALANTSCAKRSRALRPGSTAPRTVAPASLASQ